MPVRAPIPYEPFEQQQQLHASPKKFKAAAAGARGGKSRAGAFESVQRAIHQPGYQQTDIDAGRPYKIACGAPTFPMLKTIVIPTVRELLPKALIVHESKSDLIITIRAAGKKRYSEIHFKNCEKAERWEGLQLYHVWLDEVAQMKREIFDEATTRVSDRDGTIIATGTPKGKNWFYQEFFSDKAQADGENFGIQYPTSANPYFPRHVLELRKRRLPRRYYLRTYEASFENFLGQIYEELDPKVHFVTARDVPKRWAYSVAGVDWGWNNRGVILVALVTYDGDYWIVEEDSAQYVLIDAEKGDDCWVNRARALQKKYGIRAFYCDPSAPGNIESFNKAQLNAYPAENEVLAGILNVATLFRIDPKTQRARMHIVKERCPNLVQYLPSYHWQEKDDVIKDEPAKEEDHECDALRYLVYTDLSFSGGAVIMDGGAALPY